VRAWNTYLLAFFLLLCGWSASAQPAGWDAALDRYERICDQCIDLRQRSLSGEAVPAASVTGLLGQLASLRSTLQEAAGRMTPSQRARFESIRLRYAEAFASPDRPSISLESPEKLPSFAPGIAVNENIIPLHDFVPPVSREVTASPHPRLSGGLVAFAALPPVRPGLASRLDLGRPGLFVKASWLPAPEGSYSCLSDGTAGNGFIWTSGNERSGAFSASAGLSYALVQGKAFSLRFYAGAGYGRLAVRWEDASGRWADVSDLARRGLVLDGGAFWDFGHITVMTGVSCLSRSKPCLEAGVGYVF
jgi:hypothetical protein